MVVAAETQGLARDSLPGVERSLADLGVVSGWRLTPSLQLGVISMRAPQHGAVLEVLRGTASARTGVSPVYRSIADTPRALQLARAALSVVPDGKAEVHVFSPSPLAALVAREPVEGRRLADEVLGPVLSLTADDRASMLDTLVAYLDNGASAERTSVVLSCHANTVRYRLRRLQALTGRSLSDPHGLAEFASAVLALRLGPYDRGRSPQAPSHEGGVQRVAAQETDAEPGDRGAHSDR
ncbi:MAG: helix-turn-helix domain-containing protein [Solirubrobacteraceae bacterium]